MKKIIKTVSCIALALALAFTAICVYAVTYSSEDDPLVSLSYINEVLIPQIKDMFTQMLGGSADTPDVTIPEGAVSTGSKYVTVNVKAGQALYASVNSCEVIVRSGHTTVVSPFTEIDKEQGLPDVTAGTEIYDREIIPTNHSLIIPRDDGRGIVVGEGGAWIMVRGDYIIKDTDIVVPALVTTVAPVATTTASAETSAVMAAELSVTDAVTESAAENAPAETIAQ